MFGVGGDTQTGGGSIYINTLQPPHYGGAGGGGVGGGGGRQPRPIPIQ